MTIRNINNFGKKKGHRQKDAWVPRGVSRGGGGRLRKQKKRPRASGRKKLHTSCVPECVLCIVCCVLCAVCSVLCALCCVLCALRYVLCLCSWSLGWLGGWLVDWLAGWLAVTGWAARLPACMPGCLAAYYLFYFCIHQLPCLHCILLKFIKTIW